MTSDRRDHWDSAYTTRPETQLSWHQNEPQLSLELATIAGVQANSSVIDIGGGLSRFVDTLMMQGFRDVTVLDISPVSQDVARKRLGTAASSVTWITADVTRWEPLRTYDLWHDRALFHFMVQASDREAYLRRLSRAVVVGGHAIIATFAPDGPGTCSGLPVTRYSPDQLAMALGDCFAPVTSRRHIHRTPLGRSQPFNFCLFRKLR